MLRGRRVCLTLRRHGGQPNMSVSSKRDVCSVCTVAGPSSDRRRLQKLECAPLLRLIFPRFHSAFSIDTSHIRQESRFLTFKAVTPCLPSGEIASAPSALPFGLRKLARSKRHYYVTKKKRTQSQANSFQSMGGHGHTVGRGRPIPMRTYRCIRQYI